MDRATETRSIADFPDIIYDVVCYLDPGRPRLSYSESKAARQSLARLARTCRNFSHPALKLLWKRLPDDQPLADLLCALGIARRDKMVGPLPSPQRGIPWPLSPAQMEAVAQRYKMMRGFYDIYTLCDQAADDPSAHPNWKRFEEYASYVQTIAKLWAYDGPEWCKLWEALTARLGSARPLLPCLHSASFGPDRTPHLLVVGSFLLLSPSVTALEYRGQAYDNPLLQSALSLAFERAPGIEKLGIPTQPWEDMHTTLGNRVTHVEVFPLAEPKRLLHLSKFPHLRSMSISLRIFIELELEGRELAYPLLDTLEVKGDWKYLTPFLNAISAPNLCTLSAEAWECARPPRQVAESITECLHVLSAKHPRMTSLSVVASSGSPSVSWPDRIVQEAFPVPLLDVVRPLLALHALCAFTLILPNYIDMTCSSDDFLAVSDAWRDLEALHIHLWDYFTLKGLSNHPGAGERSRGGPFAALAHFARNCPRLRALHLPPMDATQFGVPGEALYSSCDEVHGLQNLIVSKLRVDAEAEGDRSAERVAEFVKGVFPSAAWPFRKEGLTLVDGWLVVPEKACCFDCDDLQLTSARTS